MGVAVDVLVVGFASAQSIAGRMTKSPTSAAKIVTQDSNEKSRVVGISLICKLPKPASSTSDVMIMAEPTA